MAPASFQVGQIVLSTASRTAYVVYGIRTEEGLAEPRYSCVGWRRGSYFGPIRGIDQSKLIAAIELLEGTGRTDDGRVVAVNRRLAVAGGWQTWCLRQFRAVADFQPRVD